MVVPIRNRYREAPAHLGFTIIGQIAHITAANSRGPRFDPTMTNEERRDLPNLLMFCKGASRSRRQGTAPRLHSPRITTLEGAARGQSPRSSRTTQGRHSNWAEEDRR